MFISLSACSIPRCTPRAELRRLSSAHSPAHRTARLSVSRTPKKPSLRVTHASPADSSGAGPMSSTVIDTMKKKIQDSLKAEKVEVVDVEGDARHVTINVVSTAFEGKSSVDRQRMVYRAIWFELQDAVHAVDSMTTATPSEAAPS